MAQLEVEDVIVRFGGHVAVDDVSVRADAGRITGLIGPNGAGKTTLFNVITGLLTPNAGRVKLDDRDITKLPPYKRARRGIARTFQRLELFSVLTVRENIAVAAETRRSWAHDGAHKASSIDAIIERIGLQDCADERVDSLPTGQARLVELGRSLASRPSVLLLDEPASGQTESETQRFADLLRELSHEGMTVLVVEHDMQLVMSVCDTICVLDFGRIIATGTPEEIRTNDAVLAAYLGTKKVGA
ncbi:MAG: ABC-type branched-chain amino acid transport system, ATPase component [Actinomycetia bacterium]|nr:ABC-type branched-chain amino acid transport system, ATPase component [Actinomycetes bacterium]